MSQFRIVRYCDDVLYAVQHLVKDDWQYIPVYRPRDEKLTDVRDMTFETLDEARRAAERLKAKEQARIDSDNARVIEEL